MRNGKKKIVSEIKVKSKRISATAVISTTGDFGVSLKR